MAARDETWTPAQADRPPTADEARAAELALAGVDVDRVAKHASEMAKLGAKVQGEGQIVPFPKIPGCTGLTDPTDG